MKILKFTLEGKTAFFKIPEVNSYYSFTYGNIHKVALMGIFGAILGYGGYSQMVENDLYPEFYEKLHGLEVAIVPRKGSKGYIAKKIQIFNNSIGYASQEQGGNLIVKQQWLESPWWEIYLKIQDEESDKVKCAILQNKCIYIPYLGSNDHFADIKNAELLDGRLADSKELERIDSFFPEGTVELDYEDDEIIPFLYSEFLPIGLEKETNMYQQKKILFTNFSVIDHKSDVIIANHKNLIFF